VGGLTKVKEWICSRECWFAQDGQPELRPRAILLEGFPGCGKSDYCCLVLFVILSKSPNL
jgi:hypothetical protein